ncbi:hypothetical protein FSP39_018885 [Pinctada imbricata]|uniref:Uncharacterized protein n=1 Tax=Pinctada imbricata TaxID=66713 RepID=A0AA88XN13_PINIB|nr:hypothetical protein FSP39_018885 [Pinctada imbricata]
MGNRCRLRTAIYHASSRRLGSRQDLDGNFCLAFLLNVMTPETNFEGQYVPNLWEFSTCSVTYFEDFLEPFR